MRTEFLVMVLVGLALMANGYFLFARRKYAEWALSVGRGRIWVRLLGQERAIKLTRYFFGPLCILLGLACAGVVMVEAAVGR